MRRMKLTWKLRIQIDPSQRAWWPSSQCWLMRPPFWGCRAQMRLMENQMRSMEKLAAIGESLVSVPAEPQPINHLSSNLEKWQILLLDFLFIMNSRKSKEEPTGSKALVSKLLWRRLGCGIIGPRGPTASASLLIFVWCSPSYSSCPPLSGTQCAPAYCKQNGTQHRGRIDNTLQIIWNLWNFQETILR